MVNHGFKNIYFLLPSARKSPAGGHKVVYEYANYFACQGYNAVILYAAYVQGFRITRNFIRCIRHYIYIWYLWLDYVSRLLLGRLQQNTWFKFDGPVTETECFRYAPYIRKLANVERNSVFVATALKTSFDLNDAGIGKERCFYFIQDFESWGVPDVVVYDSYRLSLQKITISQWLVDRINSVGQDAILISNGFNFNYFKKYLPICSRRRYEVAMLYHLDDRKGCYDAIAALNIIKSQIPELHVNMFGVPQKPRDLPEWISYYCTPDKESLNKIYNNSAIYVSASKAEGFGLTVGEAMICGCAIACTDTGGFRMMVRDGETGVVSAVGDIRALANNVIKLIHDDGLRIHIAEKGNEYIKKFTWRTSFKLFETIINGDKSDQK